MRAYSLFDNSPKTNIPAMPGAFGRRWGRAHIVRLTTGRP